MNRLELDREWARLATHSAAEVAQALPYATAAEPAALVLRGIARYEAGDFAGAREDFDLVLSKQSENAVARLHRGLALYRLGETGAALADFTAAPIFPERQWVKRALRVFWPIHFEHPAVLEHGLAPLAPPADLQAAVEASRPEVSPSDKGRKLAARLAARGVKAYFKEDHRLALWCFENAVALDPDDRDSAANACWVGLRIGQVEKAASLIEPLIDGALETYLEKKERDVLPTPGMTAMYAWLLHERGDHRGALAVLSTMRPEGPDDYHSYIVAGLAWMLLGEDEKSSVCLDAALGDFFLDTWQQFVEPYLRKVFGWLGASA
ncbi:MAG: hypothetical protein PWP23_29 [Candidatus Sumerlaeota bacterium]|nr:hypothetical protein [Candidatus Sumerlaeota bacterium]